MSCEIPVSSGRSEESSVTGSAQGAGDRQPRALRLECKCKTSAREELAGWEQ